MKFDPHLLKYIFVAAMLLLKIFARSNRKKSRPLPTKQMPSQNPKSQAPSKSESPWSKTDDPFNGKS